MDYCQCARALCHAVYELGRTVVRCLTCNKLVRSTLLTGTVLWGGMTTAGHESHEHDHPTRSEPPARQVSTVAISGNNTTTNTTPSVSWTVLKPGGKFVPPPDLPPDWVDYSSM